MRVISRFGLGLGFIGLGAAVAQIQYLYLAALNASQTAPLTATPTNVTQIATGSVTVPLYTDTSGASQVLTTVPAGYPVVPGARISYDVANGAVLGAELITVAADREFSSDTGFWTKSTNVTIADGKAVFAGVTTAGLRKSGLLTVGKKYRATYTVEDLTEGSLKVYVGGGGLGTKRTANGTYTEDIFCVADTTLYFYVDTVGSNTFKIDNVSVREITPAYLPTTSEDAAIATGTTLASGLTRYDGSGLGVLAEASATNPFLQSQEFDATWTASELTVDDQAAVAPDGTTTADKLIPSIVDSSVHSIIQAITLTAATYTFSVYAKAAGYNFLAMKSEVAGYVEFNLATGAAPTIVGGIYTAAITALADDWYRCSITYTGTAASYQQFLYVYNATGAGSYSGDGTSGLYLWGAQLETGSLATSYIATTTAAVTRAARYTSIPGTNLGSKLNFVLYSYEASGRVWNMFYDGTNILKHDGTNIVFTDGTTTLSAALAITANTQYHIGLDTTPGAWSLSVDGTAVDTDATGGAVEWGETVYVGSKVVTGTASETLNGTISVIQSSSDAKFDEASEL